MKIKNYTSGVPIERSVSAIETLLVSAGATAISKFYDDNKELAGVIFQIPYQGLPVTFKLPAKPDAVRKVLEGGVKKFHRDTKKRIKEQSGRTAWSLLRDWVHTQLSMIQMEQAEAIQVFLAYQYNGSTDKTFFEVIKENGMKQLTDGKHPK